MPFLLTPEDRAAGFTRLSETLVPPEYPFVQAVVEWYRSQRFPWSKVSYHWAVTAQCPFRVERYRRDRYAKPHVHFHGGGTDPSGPRLGYRGADCGGGTYFVVEASQ